MHFKPLQKYLRNGYLKKIPTASQVEK